MIQNFYGNTSYKKKEDVKQVHPPMVFPKYVGNKSVVYLTDILNVFMPCLY